MTPAKMILIGVFLVLGGFIIYRANVPKDLQAIDGPSSQPKILLAREPGV